MIIISTLIYYMLEAYKYSLIIYILMSYFPQTRQTRISHFLGGLIEPVLEKLRFLSIGIISFAPIVVFMVIQVIQIFLVRIGVIGINVVLR